MAWRTSSALLLTACLAAMDRHEAGETHMGTLFRVTVYADNADQARDAIRAAFARASELDAALSDYKPDSELNRLCRAGSARVNEDLFRVLEVALVVARESDGAFDPTVGPLTRLWRESRRTGALPSDAVRRDALARTGWRHVRLNSSTREVRLARRDMQLDLGGIAKGYAADEMLRVLRQRGLPRALVAAGGDIVVGDAPPDRAGWRVAVGQGGPVRELVNGAVSTSGASEQFVELSGVRYSHVVDPRTGLGLTSTRTVSVVAGSGMFADACATALSVMAPNAGAKFARRFQSRKRNRANVIFSTELFSPRS